MALPSLPRKEKRPIPITVRLSYRSATYLKELAKAHNMSQADVIEHLLENEWKDAVKKKVVTDLYKRPAP